MMVAVMLVIAACSENVRKVEVSDPKKLEELAQKNGCTACHSLDGEGTGPSWLAVARRYTGETFYEYSYNKYSLEEGLARKASLGGWHDWGGNRNEAERS